MSEPDKKPDLARRKFIKGLGSLTASAGAVSVASPAWGGRTLSDTFADFFQAHYQQMTSEEITQTLERIELKAKRRYNVDINCKNTPPQDGVVFGYAINISKCRG